MIPFERAWRDQQLWQQRLFEEPSFPEAVWILQPPAWYTLGRGASAQYLPFDPHEPPAPLTRRDRGGGVTHHVTGQLGG